MLLTSDARVLLIGLDPRTVDYDNPPGGIDLDEATLTSRIEAAHAAVRAAGFDLATCLVDRDADKAEPQVRERFARDSFDLVLIGAGIRLIADNTLLFERVINLVGEAAPGIKLCFNTNTPEDSINALRRWIQPATDPK